MPTLISLDSASSWLRPRHLKHLLPGLLLLVCPPFSQALVLPLAIQESGTAPELEFGLSYRELAATWRLLPWKVEKSLLPFPAEAFSREEIKLFSQPFLTRFLFDQADATGRLLALHMVHWEKRGSKNLDAFIGFMENLLGKNEPRRQLNQEEKLLISVWQWPNILFSCRQDENGQTWYLSIFSPRPPANIFMPGLPLGERMDKLENLLEPGFSASSPWPARGLRQNPLSLAPNGLAEAYGSFLFSGYQAQDRMVGALFTFPSLPGSSWQEAALDELKDGFTLLYGPPRCLGTDEFIWENQGGTLSLRRRVGQGWHLLAMSALAPEIFPVLPKQMPAHPQPDILGWDKFQWHMPLSVALDLCPPSAQTGALTYGAQNRFIACKVKIEDQEHSLRLFFNTRGLYQIMLSYDCLECRQNGQYENMLASLRRSYGDSQWQSEDEQERVYHWARAHGYLKFIISKVPGYNWRLLFTGRED